MIGTDLPALNRDGVEVLWFDDLGTGNLKYRFLSNFYEGEPLVLSHPRYAHIEFRTGEHAFQALKATSWDDFHHVNSQPAPNPAKAAGRSISLRSDWERVKYDVMGAVLRAKFTIDREEGTRLLNTGSAYLCEGTMWRDRVWGVDLREPNRPGRNWLGTLLMARRAELRAHVELGVAIPNGYHNVEYFCEFPMRERNSV